MLLFDAIRTIPISMLSTWLLFLSLPGFRMLEAFNITDRTFAGMNGVSMEPGSFNSYIAYRLHKDSFLNQPTK